MSACVLNSFQCPGVLMLMDFTQDSLKDLQLELDCATHPYLCSNVKDNSLQLAFQGQPGQAAACIVASRNC